MSDQIQCPNCGGYKATSQKVSVKQITPISSEQRLKTSGIYLVVTAVLLVGMLILLAMKSGYATGCGAFALLYLIAMFVSLLKTNTTKVIGSAYDFSCLICGYRWEWREDQKWPEVHVRPDLIAKGEQRLSEEERKRQQDAAALYYLTHKK